ncbi:MAG: transposase, partial [Bermanella sp.]
MNNKKLQAMAEELAKDLKTPDDLSQLSATLTKLTVEAALKGEMNHHLGYDKHDLTGHHSGNSRNGYSIKKLKGDHGEIEIQTPRDRNATFEPQLVKKGQSRITGMDEQILSLLLDVNYLVRRIASLKTTLPGQTGLNHTDVNPTVSTF